MSIEQRPGFDDIISSRELEEHVPEVRAQYRQLFEEQDFHNLKDKEVEKTAEERVIIGLANETLAGYRTAYHLPPSPLPEKNLHVIAPDAWEFGDRAGVYSPKQLGVLVERAENNLVFAEVAFHEMAHFASYNVQELTKDGIHQYRFGLEAATRPEWSAHFHLLNEAVTEKVTMRFIRDVAPQQPMFAETIERAHHEREKDPGATTTSGRPFVDDETYAVYPSQRADGTTRLRSHTFTYRAERQALDALCAKLAAGDAEHRTAADIEEMFIRAMFTGNILSLGKMIDRRYGAGSFRELGRQKTTEELQTFVEKLS